jgi:uracil-DNA glycosylase family 4
MKDGLRNIHRKLKRCRKCAVTLNDKVLPRSGFPARDHYKAVMIGAEPGPKAKGVMTPTEYEKYFLPGAKNNNRIRLLFEDLKDVGVDYSLFFYTNAVKCPADPKKGQSRKCILNCEAYLQDQLNVIRPKLLVIIGSAASLLRIKIATKNSIERSKYLAIPAIIIRHPQAASKEYRQRVARRIKSNFARLNLKGS